MDLSQFDAAPLIAFTAKQSAERGTAITRSTSPRTYWIVTSHLMAPTPNGHALLVALLRQSAIKAEIIWRNRWDTRSQAEAEIFQYINDGVDAPPGGIAMCQNDSSLNCHTKEEHPWRMLV